VADAKSLRRALDGQEAVYYLVHSLASEDFATKDRLGAIAFAEAASGAGRHPGHLPGWARRRPRRPLWTPAQLVASNVAQATNARHKRPTHTVSGSWIATELAAFLAAAARRRLHPALHHARAPRCAATRSPRGGDV